MDLLDAIASLDLAANRIGAVGLLAGAAVRAVKPFLGLPAKAWPWVSIVLALAFSLGASWQDLRLAPGRFVVEGLLAGALAIGGHELAKGMLGSALSGLVLGRSKARREDDT